MESVQVRVLTNIAPSLALGDRSRAAARHPPSTGRKCFLSGRGNTVFSLFFSVFLCFSLDFLGEAKKVRLFGESGFFYWGFGGIQAVKAGIFLRFLLHIG